MNCISAVPNNTTLGASVVIMTGAQGVFKGTLCTTRGGWRYVRTRYGLLIKAAVACFDLYRRLSRADLYIRIRAGDWLCPLFNSALSPREIMVVNQMVPGLIRNTGNETSVDICGLEIWFLWNKYLDNMYIFRLPFVCFQLKLFSSGLRITSFILILKIINETFFSVNLLFY